MLNINKELSIMRKWLKDIRLAKGLSQLDVAKKVHITFQYYSYIENGERRPSPQVAKRIAVALGFPDTWYRLLEDNDQKDECEKRA